MDEQHLSTGQFLQLHIAAEEQRFTQLESEIQDIKNEITSLREEIQDLVDAWKTANGVVAFVKWIAGIVTAIGALVLFFKTGVK